MKDSMKKKILAVIKKLSNKTLSKEEKTTLMDKVAVEFWRRNER